MRKIVKNQSGQGLIEYLIIVALMGVAAIAIMRVMSQTVSSRFASITFALQGKKESIKMETVDESAYSKKSLGDFMDGVSSKGNSSGASH